MKKLYEESFEVWCFNKLKDGFVGKIDETFKSEVDAITKKRELNSLLDGKLKEIFTYRIVKVVRTSDLTY